MKHLHREHSVVTIDGNYLMAYKVSLSTSPDTQVQTPSSTPSGLDSRRYCAFLIQLLYNELVDVMRPSAISEDKAR